MNKCLQWIGWALCFGLLAYGQLANAGEQTYTLSLATWGAPSHPQVKFFAKQFMKRVEQRSHGRIKFKYFPNNQLVKEAFVSTALPLDTVDISLATIDSWAGMNQDVSITTTPLWTLSMNDAKRELVPGKPLFDYFSRSLKKNGVRPLALFDIGPGVITSNFSLNDPKDMHGKLLRSVSKGTAEVIQGLGAAPVVMSVGDVYFALQSHTVDGALGGLQGAYGLRHYEVSKYVMATNYLLGTFIHGYFMNEHKLESLPKDLQDIITTAATESRNEAEDNLIKTYPDYLKKMVKGGDKLFNPQKGTADWQTWGNALVSFKAACRKRYNPQLLALLPAAS